MPVAIDFASIIRSVIMIELVATIGCASLGYKSIGGKTKGAQATESNQLASGSPKNTIRGTNLVAKSTSHSDLLANMAGQGPSEDSSISATVASMFERMADAARIKPRIIPAEDPTKLATKHENLGPEVYITAARIQEKHGNTTRALSLYQKACQVAPNKAGPAMALARFHVDQEDFNEALDIYHNALEGNMNDPALHNDIGVCYVRMQRLDDAIASFSQALHLEQDNTRYRNNLTETLVEAGLPQEAYAQLHRSQNEAEAHYRIGCLLERRGDLREASLHLGKALSANPNLFDARDLMHQINVRLAEHSRALDSPPRRIRPIAYELSVSDQGESNIALIQCVEGQSTAAMDAIPPSLLPLDILRPPPPSPADIATLNL